MNRIRSRSSASPGKLLPSFAVAFVRPFCFTAAALVAAALLPAVAQAQDPVDIPPPSDTVYQVGLADGSTFYARITEVDQERVVFTTVGGGRLEVERSQIRSLSQAVGGVADGEFWHPDPADTRLFFASTGRNLAAGEAYVGTYMIVLPFAAVGLTDRIEIYGGAPLTLGELQPYYLGAKVQVVRTPGVQASVGTLAFVFESDAAGIAYGVGTFGTEHRAFHAGIGFFYAGDEVANEPAFMFGGETRVSRRMKLITENYILPNAVGVIFSGGLRIIGDRFSAELGMFGAASGDTAGCCFPLVNFNYTFGR